MSNIKEKYDVVVIGSGLGGLVCSYILARNGYHVGVFEKNRQIGGSLQTFVRKGVKFETGMHYVGSMNEGENLHRFFKYLSLLDDVKMSPLDEGGYDIISLDGERYKFASGKGNFINTLAEKFPDNRADIEKYVETISRIGDNSPLYSFKNIGNISSLDPSSVKQSVDESIAQITDNPTLQNVLAGNVPLNAALKGKTPFYVHALINDFYIRSAYRIMGGSDAIASSLAASIERMGGYVFAGSPVVKILCDEHRATGVRLADGREIKSDFVVSAIHPERFVELTDTPMIRNVYKERIRNLENSVGSFTIYIKFKKDAMPYMNSNFYHYDSPTVWDCEYYKPEEWPQSFLYMHQSVEPHQRWAQSGLVISYMRWDEVQQWDGTQIGKRGADYDEFKRRKAELLLDSLERQMPGVRDCIEEYWTSTPLTYKDYTGTKDGSMYGVVRDKNFPVQTLVSQRTKIPNVFLTGQNINSHGILGVIIGAIITSSEFVGIDKIVKQIVDTEKS